MNRQRWMGVGMLALGLATSAQAASPARLLQSPVLSATHLAFVSGGDLWVAPRGGGKAVRLTTGNGIEQAPSFSPDGQTIAFTGEYDGNTDVFTLPVAGGVPTRLTFPPPAENAVGRTAHGPRLLFLSNRPSAPRHPPPSPAGRGGG